MSDPFADRFSDALAEVYALAGPQIRAAWQELAPPWLEMSATEAVPALESELRREIGHWFQASEPELDDFMSALPSSDAELRRSALLGVAAFCAFLVSNGLAGALTA